MNDGTKEYHSTMYTTAHPFQMMNAVAKQGWTLRHVATGHADPHATPYAPTWYCLWEREDTIQNRKRDGRPLDG